MQTVAQIFSATFEEKKSTFIAYVCPIDAFLDLHVRLKNEHPKAAHIVWAKRFFNEYRQIVENNSDDGEPKGTSGPPVLNVLRGFELVDVGVLIVRYFGGIKLGTGGLVRAYGNSTKEVIAKAALIPFEFKERLQFLTPYGLIPRFEHYCTTKMLPMAERSFDETGALWSLELSEAQKEAFLNFALPYEQEGFRVL
jgi:uncharacterized YigZ family protein